MTEDPKSREKVDVRALKERLLTTFRSPTYKPPMLPAVATELMALTKRPDAGFNEVTRVLERDPNLAGAVLKLAQSPLYATRIAPTSLTQAVQRLGLMTVRDMVFQVVMDLRVFRAEGYKDLMERVRRHSIVTAHVMRALCAYTPLASDQAFLAGLLHDVGLGAVMLLFGEMHPTKRPSLDATATAAAETHHEIGAVMARVWQLAPELQLVIAQHHDFKPNVQNHPLVAALTAAEAIADELGFGVNDIHTMNSEMAIASSILDRTASSESDAAFTLLRISPQTRQVIMREAASIPLRAFG